jgi:hypothetical protein
MIGITAGLIFTWPSTTEAGESWNMWKSFIRLPAVIGGWRTGPPESTDAQLMVESDTAANPIVKAKGYTSQTGDCFQCMTSAEAEVWSVDISGGMDMTTTLSITGATPIILEGATEDAYETSIAVTDPVNDATITIPELSYGTFGIVLSSLAANGPGYADSVSGGTNQIIFEGTSDAYENILTAEDATADVLYTLPDAAAATYGLVPSTLAANGVDIVNSVTAGSNGLFFEGTADDYEVALTAADATADVLYTLPDAAAATYGIAPSTLATNAVDIVNSFWGGTNQIIMEGATADAAELIITLTDPTNDNTVTFPNASGTPMLSSLANNAAEIANSVTGASDSIIFEGTSDTVEMTLTIVDPTTTDRTITLPNNDGTVFLSSLSDNGPNIVNGVWGASNAIVLEGSTANDAEFSLTVDDPTNDITVTFANASGVPVLSSLSGNAPEIANSVTNASNAIIFEGTSDTVEMTVTAADPTTTDKTITLPDADGTVMLSSLATNAPDAANSVTGGTNQLVFEGLTANTYEQFLTVADPTGDDTCTIPNATGTIMLSTLATNAPEVANSVTGASNALVFEGTSNTVEMTVTASDPTISDRTITLPDYTGDVPLVISQSANSTACANDTCDIDGSSLTIADGWFSAGKTLRWTNAGSISGGNAAKNFILYIDGSAIITLASQAATATDYEFTCTMHEHTDFANQKVFCKAIIDSDVQMDYASNTTDFNDGGSTEVSLQIVSGNAGDTVTSEFTMIEHWN